MDDQPLTSGPLDSVSRRRLLGLIGAGTAGTAIAVLTADTAKAGHDGTNVPHLGEVNEADEVTELHVELAAVPDKDLGSLAVFTNLGMAIGGSTEAGTGVAGHSSAGVGEDPHVGVGGSAAGEGGIGVRGESTTGDGVGVEGLCEGPGVGVKATSTEGIGVLGESHASGQPSPGMFGISENGSGVLGASNAGAGPPFVGGVSGFSENGIGVKAQSPNGDALWVDGTSRFSTAGAGTVPEGEDSVTVANTAVTADSHISVTLAADPGASRVLQWVEKEPGVGFTVHLTSAPPPRRRAVDFTYLAVESM